MVYFLSNMVMVYCILYIMLFLHEMGHYGVGKLLGISFDRVKIGLGPNINFMAGKEEWSFHLIPIAGSVSPSELAVDERKNLLMIAAGPLVNASLVIVGILGVIFTPFLMFFLFFVFMNAVAFIENIIPWGNTDGKQFIYHWKLYKRFSKRNDKIKV